jgi:hypothetical protein
MVKILPMIRTAPSSKLLLVADRRAGADGATAVRRYRLARLRLDVPRTTAAGRSGVAGRS